MNTKLQILGLIITSLVFAGCHTSKVIMLGNARQPISSDMVTISDTQPQSGEAIAIVFADSGGDSQEAVDRAMRRLKEKAAELGANVVVINTLNTSTRHTYPYGTPVHSTKVSAKAYYVPK